MYIEVYLNKDPVPIQVLTPPEKFNLDTTTLEDGRHELTFKAFDANGVSSVRVIPVIVQNGPAIAIHGIEENEQLSGQISILANAYSANIGDEFEPIRMETPAPVPTWAWVLFLSIIAWGAGYISLEIHNRVTESSIASSDQTTQKNNAQQTSSANTSAEWAALGEQVYGNNCASCHQADGSGLPGVFPPLKNNPAVIDSNPAIHIRAVLHGVTGKVIEGIAYASPMPGFAEQLNDEEVAAVVNHERTQWGNNAATVNAADVAALR